MRGVQQHVKQGEFDLPEGLQAALEVLRSQHLVEQVARQGLTAIDVGCHVAQHIPLPAEVLHELARQFDGVPFDAADARHIEFLDLGQEVVQAVPEFVKQGGNVVVRQQRGLVTDGVGEVADQVRHRRLQLAAVGAQPACAHVIHPGATAFASACCRVQIELAKQCAGTLHPVKPDPCIPDRCLVLADADIKQGLHDFE